MCLGFVFGGLCLGFVLGGLLAGDVLVGGGGAACCVGCLSEFFKLVYRFLCVIVCFSFYYCYVISFGFMYPKPRAGEDVWVFWRVPLTRILLSTVPKLHVHILKERWFVFLNCGVEPEPPQRNNLHPPMSFSSVLHPTIYSIVLSCVYVVRVFFRELASLLRSPRVLPRSRTSGDGFRDVGRIFVPFYCYQWNDVVGLGVCVCACGFRF